MSKTAHELITELKRNVPKVYSAGVAKGIAQSGYDEAYNRGYEAGVVATYDTAYEEGSAAGKQTEAERFWGAYLVGYQGESVGTIGGAMFAGAGWNAETFKPTRDINVIDARQLFYDSNIKVDLVNHMNALGRSIDFRHNNSAWETFYGSSFTRIGAFYANEGWYNTFAFCDNLVTIDEFGSETGGDIVPSEDSPNSYKDLFYYCTALENVRVKGKLIAQLIMSHCPKLTRDSIVSIVNALSTDVGRSVSFSASAVDDAFDGGSDGDEWNNLIATKPNWSFALMR